MTAEPRIVGGPPLSGLAVVGADGNSKAPGCWRGPEGGGLENDPEPKAPQTLSGHCPPSPPPLSLAPPQGQCTLYALGQGHWPLFWVLTNKCPPAQLNTWTEPLGGRCSAQSVGDGRRWGCSQVSSAAWKVNRLLRGSTVTSGVFLSHIGHAT